MENLAGKEERPGPAPSRVHARALHVSPRWWAILFLFCALIAAYYAMEAANAGGRIGRAWVALGAALALALPFAMALHRTYRSRRVSAMAALACSLCLAAQLAELGRDYAREGRPILFGEAFWRAAYFSEIQNGAMFLGVGFFFFSFYLSLLEAQKDKRMLIERAQALETEVKERARTAEALRRSEDASLRLVNRLGLLREIDLAFLRVRSSEEALREGIKGLRRMIPCYRIGVVEFDEAKREATLIALEQDGPSAVPVGYKFRLEDFAFDDVLRFGQVRIVEDVYADSAKMTSLIEKIARDGMRSYINAPMIVQGRTIGSLNLNRDFAGPFSRETVEIVQDVANSLAAALVHSRMSEQIRRDAETKGLLLQEVNHRVKNNLASIIGILYSERKRIAPDSATPGAAADHRIETLVNNLISRVQSLAAAHGLLSATNWRSPLAHQIAELCIDAAKGTIPPGRSVSVLAAPSGIRVSPAQAHSLALIINELAANVHKHVLAQRASVCIDVSFSLDGDSILMVFRDDGPGFPASIVSRDVNGGGTGFEIIGNLARRSLKGTIRLSNEPGATVRLRFPIDATMDNTNRIAREGGYS